MLFNEPKLLKFVADGVTYPASLRFSALQRAEIAEIAVGNDAGVAIQRRFSALQRAEIAEMYVAVLAMLYVVDVSVLFNEPKLLK